MLERILINIIITFFTATYMVGKPFMLHYMAMFDATFPDATLIKTVSVTVRIAYILTCMRAHFGVFTWQETCSHQQCCTSPSCLTLVTLTTVAPIGDFVF